jgi:predicted MFS family arabinose efflux permease
VMGLLAAWFAPRRRGLAAGIGVAGSSLALILLGPVTPRILAGYGEMGWRVFWFGLGGVTVLLAGLGFLVLRNAPREVGLRPVGSGPTDSSPPAPSGRLEWGTVYRSGAVWHLGLVYVAFGFSYIIYVTFFVKCLIAEGGYSAQAAGGLFMVMGWCSLLCGLIWGTVSDVIGRKWALAMVYLVHAVAFGLFGLWPVPTGFTLSAVLFGLSAWSIPAIMAAACGDMVGPRLTPTALGFVTLFFGIGQALGPTVAGAMADAIGSLLPSMILASGVALLGAVAAALLRPIVGEDGGGHAHK